MNPEEEYVANNVLPYLPEKGQKERFLEVNPKIAAVLGEKRIHRILEISDYDVLKSEMAAVKRETEIIKYIGGRVNFDTKQSPLEQSFAMFHQRYFLRVMIPFPPSVYVSPLQHLILFLNVLKPIIASTG